MMGLPDGRKSFKIGLAVLIQYRRVTSSHPASHVAVALHYITFHDLFGFSSVERQIIVTCPCFDVLNFCSTRVTIYSRNDHVRIVSELYQFVSCINYLEVCCFNYLRGWANSRSLNYTFILAVIFFTDDLWPLYSVQLECSLNSTIQLWTYTGRW